MRAVRAQLSGAHSAPSASARSLLRLLEVHLTGQHCARAASWHQERPLALIRLSAPPAMLGEPEAQKATRPCV